MALRHDWVTHMRGYIIGRVTMALLYTRHGTLWAGLLYEATHNAYV